MKKFLLCLSLFLAGCSQQVPMEPEEPIIVEEPEVKEDSVVSFMAVGDNLIHGAIYYDAMQRYGEYVFDPIYEPVKEFVQSKDVAYINQETMLGGTELGLSSYPAFNSPQEVGEAIADTGFDWIASSSNHSLDVGSAGVINTLNFWDNYEDIVTTGIARNFEEMNEPKFIEREGVIFGVLGYTYGTNGIPVPEGEEYLVNLISKERIEADVNAIKDQCDAILVSMHWGTEYNFFPNDEQKEYAQFLADLGVDVIIGEHPHVIQPMEWLTGAEGNQTLVIYSLGNFLSAQDSSDTMLGGCTSWDMRKDGETGEVTIENVKFYPTVTHFESGFTNFKTYLLKDYTDELAAAHGLNNYAGEIITRQLFIDLVDYVMGDTFEIVY